MNGEVAQLGPSEKVFNFPNSLSVAQFLGIENIKKGSIVSYSDGVASVQIEDFIVKVASELKEGEVFVFIRPEDIILSENLLESSARNVLKSRITEVVNIGKLYEVKVDLGLRSIVTKQSLEKFNLEIGKTIYMNFKASAVHIIQC
jgi:molybdopterin-binding protein